jgi:photosystem II stability/assembly factor-like uncharacterized protein
MKRFLALLVFSLTLLQPVAARAAEWVPIGPFGGTAKSLVVAPSDPRVLYAGTRGAGVFRSTDGGRSWERRNGHGTGALLDLDILAVAVDPSDPDRVYAGTLRRGLSRSIDGGESWTVPAQGEGLGASVQAIVVDPAHPSTAYASRNGSLLKTVDRGATWTPLAGAPYFAISLALDPSAPRTIYAGNLEGVFRSTNGGVTWTRLPGTGNGTVNALAVDPRNPATVYAAFYSYPEIRYQLFKSVDRGQTWRRSSRGLGVETGVALYSLAVDPVAPATLYAGTSRGVYKSTNAGRTWQPSNQGASDLPVSALAVHPSAPSVLWAGTGTFDIQGAGVFRTTNGGATWAPSRRGFSASWVASLALGPVSSGETPVIYVGNPGQGVYGSRNEGASWESLSTGLRGGNVETLLVHPDDPAILYAGTDAGVARSTDGGATWRRRNQGLTDAQGKVATVFSLAFQEGDPETLYAGANQQIFKSTDGGSSWRVTANLPGSLIVSLATSPDDPAALYAGGTAVVDRRADRQTYKSADGGESWSPLPLQATNVRVAADPGDAEVVLAIFVGNRLYRSADGGASFQVVELTSPAGNLRVNAVAFDRVSGMAYLAAVNPLQETLILESRDAGVTWTPLPDEGLVNSLVQILQVDEAGTLYAGTRWGGVYRLERD